MTTSATALTHYANATKYIMESSKVSDNYFILLKEVLTPLRFYLACRVCNKLLQEPMSPDHTACQHTVCYQCMGGKMKLKPSCGWCQNYENFLPNKPIVSLLHSFSKLCDYVLSSDHYDKQLKYALADTKLDISECKRDVAEILNEGRQYSCPPTDQEPDNSRTVNSTLVSTITAEPTDQRPGIKLTIRNPFKDNPQSAAKILTNKATEQKESTANSAAKDGSNLCERNTSTTAISPDKSRKTPRKIPSVSQSEEDMSVNLEKPRKKSKVGEKKGCGCGNATATPGKLTCYGQRCPCYSNHNPCLDCRCRGCRNPNKYVKIEKATDDTDNDEINVE